jgi:tRNA-splicing endonuclease subunit Sen54
MPTLAQTIALFESVPADESIESKNMIQRLKEGWRSVILAVVEAGVISFFRLADVGFGEEKIYLNIPSNNRKNRSGSRNKKP